MKSTQTLTDGTVLVRGHAHENGNELDGLKHEKDPFPARLTAAEKRCASKLTTNERNEWHRALKTIEKGWKSFLEVGLALKYIRDSQLYREDHTSWEAFCREVVGVSKTEANRQIIDAEVVETLVTPIGVTGDEKPAPLPENRAQARALAQVKDAEDRRKVWEEVVAKTGNKSASARLITETATSLIPPMTPKKPAAKPRNGDAGGVDANSKPNMPDVIEMLVKARREDDWSLVENAIELLKMREFTHQPTT